MENPVVDPGEVRVLVYLMTNGPSSADRISNSLGLPRSRTYNLVSSLLCRGVIFSTGDIPQKYCVMYIDDAVDLMSESRKSLIDTLDIQKSQCVKMLRELKKRRPLAGSINMLMNTIEEQELPFWSEQTDTT
jgi:sugar-specific transcriptional regulator TrmB